MSNHIDFDYDVFYDYYTDTSKDSKILTEEKPFNIKVKYFKDSPYKKQIPIETKLSDKYIQIGDTKVYIKKRGKNGLLFTIPTEKEGSLWDFHYHFGKDDNFDMSKKMTPNNNSKPISVVFFHKTIQMPTEKGKDIQNCYYDPILKIDMDKFEELKCIQSGNKMSHIYKPQDFIYIKEIIHRPFLEQKEPTIGGKGRKTRRKNKKLNHRKSRRY